MKKIWRMMNLLLLTALLGVGTPSLAYAEEATDVNDSALWNQESDKIFYLSFPGTNEEDSDATLVLSNGHFGLIDASNPSEYGAYAVENANGKVVAEFLRRIGVAHLDFVIGTHNHSDHIGGLIDLATEKNKDGTPFIDQHTIYYYKPYETLANEPKKWNNEGYFKASLQAMTDAGARTVNVVTATSEELAPYGAKKIFTNGDQDRIQFLLGDYTIDLLNLYKVPSDTKYYDENDNSIVTVINKGRFTNVEMADLTVLQDDRFGQVLHDLYGKVNVLRAAHHGLSNGTSINLLNWTSPDFMIVSSGEERISNIPYVYYSNETGMQMIKTKDNKGAVVQDLTNDETVFNSIDVLHNFSSYDPLIPWHDNHEDWMQIGYTVNGTMSYYKLYMDADGNFLKGWQQIDGQWYYFSEEGWPLLQTNQWISSGDISYYLNGSGKLSRGFKWIDGKLHLFDWNGKNIF